MKSKRSYSLAPFCHLFALVASFALYLNESIDLYTSMKSGDPVNDNGEMGPKNINGYL